jgi:hypothetical protein
VVKARSLPLSGAQERSFTRVGSSHTHKQYIRLEVLAKEKHSSFLQTFIDFRVKIFLRFDPGRDIAILLP